MRHFSPVVILLTIMCLAGCVLLYLERDNISGDSDVESSLQERASRLPNDLQNDLPTVTQHQGDRDAEKTALPENADVADALEANAESDATSEITSESSRDISVHVTGLKNQSSTLYVAVFDSAEGFPKPEYGRTTTTVPVTSDNVEFSLALHNKRLTAIAVFQDLNGDGKLTKSRFGLPVEPYGFSNNARSLLGPPSFSQAAFDISHQTSVMEISVR